jgi:hypothetical protein
MQLLQLLLRLVIEVVEHHNYQQIHRGSLKQS